MDTERTETTRPRGDLRQEMRDALIKLLPETAAVIWCYPSCYDTSDGDGQPTVYGIYETRDEAINIMRQRHPDAWQMTPKEAKLTRDERDEDAIFYEPVWGEKRRREVRLRYKRDNNYTQLHHWRISMENKYTLLDQMDLRKHY